MAYEATSRGRRLQVTEAHFRQTVSCPTCNTPFVVPDLGAAAHAVAAAVMEDAGRRAQRPADFAGQFSGPGRQVRPADARDWADRRGVRSWLRRNRTAKRRVCRSWKSTPPNSRRDSLR